MKNSALFLVAALDLCLYLCPQSKAPEALQAVTPVVYRRVEPRVYFHSPLDAPAMLPSAFTSMGYFSTDPSREFRGGGAATPVTPAADNGVTPGGLNWGDPNEASDLNAIQKVYKLPKVGEARPTISQ